VSPPARTTNPPPAPSPPLPANIIACAVVGSTAYGLAREGSDVDTLGVFVAPTLRVAGLSWTSGQETIVRTGPDSTYHEVGKYLRLALDCNPTILDLMWADAKTTSPYGDALVAMRGAFLHEKKVRSSYGGYARAQVHKMEAAARAGDRNPKAAKHARHVLRLLRQGRQLLTTGDMTLQVADPEEYWAFDHLDPDEAKAVFAPEMELFDNATSVLPPAPDRARVEEFLDWVRYAHVTPPPTPRSTP